MPVMGTYPRSGRADCTRVRAGLGFHHVDRSRLLSSGDQCLIFARVAAPPRIGRGRATAATAMSPTSGSVGAPPARVHCKRAVRLSPAPAPAATFGGPAAGGRLKPLQTDEQERGEVAGRNFKVPDGNVDPSAADLGLSRRNIRGVWRFRILGGRAVPNGRDPLGGMSRPPLGSLRVTEVMTPRLLLNWKPPGKRQGVGRLAPHGIIAAEPKTPRIALVRDEAPKKADPAAD